MCIRNPQFTPLQAWGMPITTLTANDFPIWMFDVGCSPHCRQGSRVRFATRLTREVGVSFLIRSGVCCHSAVWESSGANLVANLVSIPLSGTIGCGYAALTNPWFYETLGSPLNPFRCGFAAVRKLRIFQARNLSDLEFQASPWCRFHGYRSRFRPS